MSAIFGIFYRDGRPVNPEELARMRAVLAHRGPDGAGVWHDGPAGLGHLMLRTTPESLNEHLPLLSRDGRLALTADARIDNRDELIAALNLRDRPAAQIADSALILAAYERWGERCVEHLLGDFAFAVWDRREQKLFCARDHFGVRPLYYYQSDRLFVFATEIKGLLALPQVPRRLNELRVAELMTKSLRDHSLTFYRDILSLPPAHYLCMREGLATLRSYWTLDPERSLHLSSDAAYAEAVHDAFETAVRRRLRSSGSLGAMLSGGLDSSSITCMARHLLAEDNGRRLYSFSAVFETVQTCNERPYIDAVLATGGLEPHLLPGDTVSPLMDLERVLAHQDEVMSAGNLHINWRAYRVAQEHKVRVVLDGFDGDSTVSHGLGFLTQLAREQRWLKLAHEVRAFSLRTGANDWHRAYLSWLRLYGLMPVTSRLRRLLPTRRNLEVRSTAASRPTWARFLHPELVRRTGIAERRAMLPPNPRTDRERQYLLLTDVGEARTLATLDCAAGAFGVEVRFPFWDRDLVELCLALPPEQKLRDGWTRIVMREAMAGILPEPIRWRGGKSDLGPAFEHNFFANERDRIERVLGADAELIAPYLDVPALRAAYERQRSNAATEQDVLGIWYAVSLAVWLRHTGLTHTTPQ